MHADPVGTTTASLVAQLPSDATQLLRCWTSLGSPCVGTFLPCYPLGRIPAVLGRGGASADDSPWWRFKRLLTLVERDFDRHGEPVRAYWDNFERTVLLDSEAVEAEATGRLQRGDQSGAAEILTQFMERNTIAMLRKVDSLIADLQRQAA
jgi:dipeptidase